jgi:hypothetical protein
LWEARDSAAWPLVGSYFLMVTTNRINTSFHSFTYPMQTKHWISFWQ